MRRLWRTWRRSTIALIPSIWPDPCPTVAIEAMALGRPVIASKIGGLPDLVDDGITGILVPPGDSDALRHAIVRLLDDLDLRERMGRAGKNKFIKFHASTVVPRIEDVYYEVAR